jgi:hypothetical protein
VLKALFNESFVLPAPIVPDASGNTLVPYPGPEVLTLGGELNKLASNLAIARVAAGVHWLSDSIEGVLLGERVLRGNVSYKWTAIPTAIKILIKMRFIFSLLCLSF